MKKYILLLLLFLVFACANKSEHKPEILLKADGSIYENNKPVSIDDIAKYSDCDEVLILVEPGIPFKKVMELMTKLKNAGVDNVGMKTINND